MAQEIEFKFLLNEAKAEALAGLDLLNEQGAPRQKRLISTYYDTPDFHFRDNKMGLRVRKSGEDWLQTLKGDVRGEDGLSIREEVELAIPEDKLDLALFKGSAFDHIARDGRIAERVSPLFTTDFQRLIWDLETEDGTTIEAALDRGSVIAGDKSEPICELELELKSGELAGMQAFAEKLLAHFPMERGSLSKAKRGYALMADS